MLHGRVVRPPEVGATLVGVDESSVSGMPGFVKVVVKKNFVGVVAEKPWQAMQIAAKLKAEWTRARACRPSATSTNTSAPRRPRIAAHSVRFRSEQTRGHGGVLPRPRRQSLARCPRSSAGAGADYRGRLKRRAGGAAICRRRRQFERRKILGAERLSAIPRRSGRQARLYVWRSAQRLGFLQDADRHRGL